MALFNTTQIQIANVGGGMVSVKAGPETFLVEVNQLRRIVKGDHKSPDFLLFQIALQLDAADIDPATRTPAQLKALIEAMTLKW